jgi:hypothetical protein
VAPLSSEWHGVQPVEPRVHSNRDPAENDEATVIAGVDGRPALRADGKSGLITAIQIDLHGKLSLGKLRVCRLKRGNDVGHLNLKKTSQTPTQYRKVISRTKAMVSHPYPLGSFSADPGFSGWVLPSPGTFL